MGSSGSDRAAAPAPAPAPTPGEPAPGAWPRIGLPTYVETARWGVWDRPAAVLPHSYIAAVIGAGGVPVMLPPVVPADGGGHSGRDDVDTPARRAVEGLDGLLLTGGADVEPHRYGDEPVATTQAARPDRDAWELALLDAALARDLPVLAICRGAQILDVATGGTLHQHVPDLVGHTNHQPGAGVLGSTPVRLAAGSLAAQILGSELKVPCYHHQSIDGLGTGVVAVGWADDGTVEAVERPDRRFVLGVQWHPEDGEDMRLFTALVAAAASSSGGGGGREPS